MPKDTNTPVREMVCYLLLAAAALVLVPWALNTSVSRSEVVDCLKWQSYAEAYPNFWLTQWQKEQCDAHNITVNAPVNGAQN